MRVVSQLGGDRLEIRDALLDDAASICAVLRSSITELCVADHGNDPALLQRWLSNKTPETVSAWIVQPGNSLLVAVENGRILAAGSVTDRGEITLNYVSPDARFLGVSRSLLKALEARARDRGVDRGYLKSTTTAHRFYLEAGYVDDGPPELLFGLTAHPMSKLLIVEDPH